MDNQSVGRSMHSQKDYAFWQYNVHYIYRSSLDNKVTFNAILARIADRVVISYNDARL